MERKINYYQPDINDNDQRFTKFENRIKLVSDRMLPYTSVVDLGCNSGFNSIYLANKGHIVTSVDNFPENRNLGGSIYDMNRFNAYDSNCYIVKQDIFDYVKFCNKYEYILCLLVLHHYLNPPKIISFDKHDLGFTDYVIDFICNIMQKCNTCYLQFRIINSNSYHKHYKLFLLSLGFKEVNVLDHKGYASPNPIFECVT